MVAGKYNPILPRTGWIVIYHFFLIDLYDICSGSLLLEQHSNHHNIYNIYLEQYYILERKFLPHSNFCPTLLYVRLVAFADSYTLNS